MRVATVLSVPLVEEKGLTSLAGSAQKWGMRIRLLFEGCKAKDFPKWAMLDKYDAFSLLVGFDPDSERQTRIVMVAAQLQRAGINYAA